MLKDVAAPKELGIAWRVISRRESSSDSENDRLGASLQLDVQSGTSGGERLLPRGCHWSALVCPRDDISIRFHTLATGPDGTGAD